MKQLLFTLILGLMTIGCTGENKLSVDVSKITIKTEIKRFDQAFYNSDEAGLGKLKSEYPYLFPLQTPDSVWLAKINDADERELFGGTQKLYSNFDAQAGELERMFKHVRYYYPNFNAPKVITLLSNVDYQRKVIYADSLMLISLDVYLGKESEIYQDFPDYIKNNFIQERMVVDAAEAITRVQIPMSPDRTFISKMIQEGKRMYLLDAYLPLVADELKMGYTKEQIEWAEYNDEEIWKYFVQNKMLFSTEQELGPRFIEEAPFSKFYQANDAESPGRIGAWFGWQIVRSYMANNQTRLQDLPSLDNEGIFKLSKYKPSK